METWKYLYACLGAALIRSYFKIMRIEIFGREVEAELLASRRDILYAGWHRGFLYYAYHYRDRRGAGIISQSRDGELIALVCKRLGIHCFRGSSSRGGPAALRDLVDYIRAGHIGGFTPDGPVGPPYASKPGIIQLAARTGAPLLAFAWDASPSYEFNSWDRTILPLPFARIAVLYDRKPISVPSGLTDEEYDSIRVEFDRRMNHLVYQARFYVKNKLRGIDPRDIDVPAHYLDYLPR
ncbi:MAG: lysophospholipid acyltransferase family protein [Deltaproteobacteria bacterium]|nr:lysophospholipid acyltransferase family protein [Deltaproteobacteria bacterium]